MVELALVGVLSIVALVAYAVHQRRDPGAVGLWLAAAGSIFAAGLCELLLGRVAGAYILRCALAGLSGSLVLAGALAYGRRRPRRWLPLLGLAVGATRALVLEAGFPALSTGIALAFESGCVALASALVFRSARGRDASLAERSLAPALLGFALLAAITVIATPPGEPMAYGLLRAWVLCVPLGLALQVAAVANRRQHGLRRRGDELERRVAERTAELEHSLAALRESEERYRTLSELASDYSFAVRLSPDYSIAFEWLARPKTGRLDFDVTSVESRRWLERIPAQERDAVRERMREVMAGEADRVEFRFLSWEGETRSMHVRFGSRALMPDGSVRIVGAGRDITELRNAEQARRRLDALMRDRQHVASLGMLAGGIAHDFNNVLTVIRGNARLALDELEKASPLRERLVRIQATAEYASELTDQMLAYSGKASLELHPLDLSRLVREALDLMRASIDEKHVLDVELCDDLPPVRGDATQLRQVLVNLVGNASEASPPDSGAIEVRTGRRPLGPEELQDTLPTSDPEPGDYVFLEIRDWGPGIDDEIRARIFEPFFTTKASGRGLGLAAVFGIVSSHRGVVQIDTPAEGGTRFRVLFPAARPGRDAEPAREPAPRARPRPGTILVVDDDEWVLELAREFLSRAGLQVWTARGGRAAVEVLRAHPEAVSAVVLDLVMPEMGGEETLRALREIRPGLPAILASGYDSETSAARLAESGGVSFVQKPYTPEDLVERVQEALGNPS